MNYRHIYHAGNFADVFKHFTLSICLEKLRKNDRFFVIDTHSGTGKYDLKSQLSLKTAEHQDGIVKFLNKARDIEIFDRYLSVVKKINKFSKDGLQYYPGSPWIIKDFLREEDRAIFNELHHDDYLQLKRNFAGNKKIVTLNKNGYLFNEFDFLKEIKDGLIFIDPPFEKGNGKENDFLQIIKYIKTTHKKLPRSTFVIWHPISDENMIKIFHQDLRGTKIRNILSAQLIIDINKSGFKGCGIVIINVPDQIYDKINLGLNLITEFLGQKSSQKKLSFIC